MSKIIRRCNVGPRWKLTHTIKVAAKDPKLFESLDCSAATTPGSSAGHWQECHWLIRCTELAVKFPTLLDVVKKLAPLDQEIEKTVYTGSNRQLVCQLFWKLISLYHAVAVAVVQLLKRREPKFHINKKWMFETVEVPARPVKDLIADLTEIGSVLKTLRMLDMFRNLARDLGLIWEILNNSERPKQPPSAQPVIQSSQIPKLDENTETDIVSSDVFAPSSEHQSVEEQEAEAETKPPSSTSKASRFTWRFDSWVRVLVAHLIACDRVQIHVATTEATYVLWMLDVPYEKLEGPSMENLLSELAVGDLAITKLKEAAQRRTPNVLQTKQPKKVGDHQPTQPQTEEDEQTTQPRTEDNKKSSWPSQFRGAIHSEMALVMSLINYLDNQPHSRGNWLYVGTSKPCCPVCYDFIYNVATTRQIEIGVGNYHLRPSPVALPPNITDALGRASYRYMEDKVAKMAASLLQPPKSPSGDVPTHRHMLCLPSRLRLP